MGYSAQTLFPALVLPSEVLDCPSQGCCLSSHRHRSLHLSGSPGCVPSQLDSDSSGTEFTLLSMYLRFLTGFPNHISMTQKLGLAQNTPKKVIWRETGAMSLVRHLWGLQTERWIDPLTCIVHKKLRTTQLGVSPFLPALTP